MKHRKIKSEIAFYLQNFDQIEYHEYVDSAVSGTSFDRPAFGQMMDDVREGKISCIIVKDMSRFGRDYIEASNYIETIFPFLGVRFISVSDHF